MLKQLWDNQKACAECIEPGKNLQVARNSLKLEEERDKLVVGGVIKLMQVHVPPDLSLSFSEQYPITSQLS